MTSANNNVVFPALWGGVECTINRRNNIYKDQLHLSQHYQREDDLQAFAGLGIKAIRYPVLWEKHCADNTGKIDWSWASQQLSRLRNLNVEPIVGLLHHGSGPAFTSLLDKNFPKKLAAYAKQVAIRFPWVNNYTPVNEPLTTARFSGLYGIWYPHKMNERDFLTMLLNQVEGVVRSMHEIRKVNPAAKLIQTEDIGKTHSTTLLQYQADFENHRRWLTYDLLCGKVTPDHPLWSYFVRNGIDTKRLLFFTDNICIPDIAGFNYYVTSERYLDEDVDKFPAAHKGSNHIHEYADIDAARAISTEGIGQILTEAWHRYHLPMAVTEAHLHCTREDQLRWFKEIWDNCCSLVKDGIDIKAVTAWSLLGAYDWNSLLVRDDGSYETGVFDLVNESRRPTAMVKLIKSLGIEGQYEHPLLNNKGWWHRHNPALKHKYIQPPVTAPLLIIGNGTLGNAFERICEQRGIYYKVLSRSVIDITSSASIDDVLTLYQPWAVINAAGYVKVDAAESAIGECFAVNAKAPALLAEGCREKNILFLTFSSDMVFNGIKRSPYMESDKMVPLNIYGKSKAQGESGVLQENPAALIIRTSAFFGPWDKNNFAYHVINALEQQQAYHAVKDVIVSPTYVPDLVNTSLDLLIDEANGIWHLSNTGSVTWADFAIEIARLSGHSQNKILPIMAEEMEWKAKRPFYSVLESEKGIKLPCLDDAVNRFFYDKAHC